MRIQDMPFENPAKDEHVKLAMAFFEDSIEKAGVGNYRIVFENGRHTDFIGRPCHAGLGAAPDVTPRVCVALYTGNKEKTDLYRKWLWEESFVAPYVLTIHEKGAVVSGGIQSILMQNIAIMSRHCLEYSGDTIPSFEMFNDIYSKVGGDLAYILSFNTVFNAVTLEHWLNSPVLNGGASHRAWPLFNLRSLQNYLNGKFGFTGDQPFTTHAGLYGGAKLCGAVNDYSMHMESFVQGALSHDDIRKELSEYRVQNTSGEMYRPPNPFAKKTPNQVMRPNDATFREVVEVIIPSMKKKELIP